MIPQTIGIRYDVGRIALVQCVKNDTLKDIYSLKLPLDFVKLLYNACKQLGITLSVDSGHTCTSWNSYHIHVGNNRVHLAIVKGAYQWLKERLK